jgi:TrmH family RNA methyltransferase
VISSNTNKQIKWVRSLQSQRSVRNADSAFVIEGTRLIQEALNASLTPLLVLHSFEWGEHHPDLLQQINQSADRVELVVDRVLASCSDVETPQGVLAVLSQKAPALEQSTHPALILDRLSDPGNLGTILRTALAANVASVYLTPGSVDIYNPKVVRAGMGAHFSLEMQAASLEHILASIEGLELWVARARQGEVYHQVNWRKPVALVIGSEAHGVDPALQSYASGECHIPIAAASESLNAATAAAVILFEIQRQRET